MVHLNIQTCVYMCMIWGIESDRLPHQLQVAFLLHPASPAQRVLVAHATGSGKTYELVAVVQNLFPMRMNTRALIYLVLHVLIWHLSTASNQPRPSSSAGADRTPAHQHPTVSKTSELL